MKRLSYLVLPALAFLVVAALPTASANYTLSTGTATACYNLSSCHYTLTNAKGSGLAWTSYNTISFKLPGESNFTYSAPYTSKVVNVSGTKNHVTGTFIGTDVNNGKVVTGATDTNITAVVHCYRTGCSTTYTLQNGTITFSNTKYDGTTTVVTCNPGSLVTGNSTKCTAKVTDLANGSKVPTGSVSFFTYVSYAGTFNHASCTLTSAGNCTVRWTPADNEVGNVYIYASYASSHSWYKSQGSALVTVSSDG